MAKKIILSAIAVSVAAFGIAPVYAFEDIKPVRAGFEDIKPVKTAFEDIKPVKN